MSDKPPVIEKKSFALSTETLMKNLEVGMKDIKEERERINLE